MANPKLLPRYRRPGDSSGGHGPKVKRYDFKRPDKFSKEQIVALSIMHEQFARFASATLTEMLRAEVEVRVAMVDQMTYQEFIDDRTRPTTLLPVSMTPLRGASILQIDADLSAAMIDTLFGGGTATEPLLDYTALERLSLGRIAEAMVGELSEAWKPVTRPAFEVREMETNKSFVMIVPPTEMIVLVTWDVSLGDSVGRLRLAVPYLVLETVLGKLSARAWYSSIRRGPAAQPPAGLATLAIGGEISLDAGALSIEELQSLSPGDTIEIPDPTVGVLRLGDRDLLTVHSTEEPERYRIDTQEPLRGSELLDRLRGNSSATDRDAAIDQSVRKAVSEYVEPVIVELRTELSRMASQQASLADTALLGRESIPQQDASARSKPFDFLRAADAPSVAVLLSGQHPQIIAMVLAHLEPRAAASVFSAISTVARPDIVARVAEIAPISPWVTTLTESYVADRLRGMGAWELQPVGGVEGASALLNYSSRGVEAEVIRALDERNSQLAESIKRTMFVFEDLAVLDPEDLRTVLAECGVEDIAVALKTADEEVRSVFLDGLEAGRLAEVTHCSEELGRLRLTEIDAAQQRIVETARRLDLAGQIDVARSEERP